MSIIRLAFIAKNYGADDPFFNAALISHFTYVTLPILTLAEVNPLVSRCVEINLAIICSCLVFAPAFVRQFRSSFGSAFGYVTKSFKSKNGTTRSGASTTLVQNTASSKSKSRSRWQISFNPPTNIPIELEPYGDGEAILQEPAPASRAATSHRSNSQADSR